MQKLSFSWKKAYVLLGVLTVLLIIRSFFGADFTDESFYFALAKRFYQGDSLLMDEWFPTQLIGALLLPFYKIYVVVNGTQDGIILCARVIYVIFSSLVSAYMLYVFQREGESCGYSFCAAVLFCIYVRAGIGTFSYYSIGLETFLLAILFLLDEKKRKFEYKWMLAGISFSVSVICMPYMVLFFAILVLLYLLRRKETHIERKGIFFALGVAVSATVFLLFFGKQLLDGMGNFREIIMDPQHQGTVWENITGVIRYLCFTYLRFTWPLYALSFIAGFGIRIKKIQSRKLSEIYRYVLYAEFLLQAIYSRTYFEGGIVFAVLLLALQIQIINPQLRIRKLEKYFLIPGLGFGLVWIIGSNVGMRVLNMGLLLADVWSIKVILEDSKLQKVWMRCLKNTTFCILFSVLILNRFCDVYRDGVIWSLDTRITSGSMKGIFTTQDRAEEYEIVVHELGEYTMGEDRLAVPGLNPWIYLEAPAKCGAYSVWNVDFTDERNWSYYNKNPDNMPDVIFLLMPSWGKYTGWRFGSHGSNTEGSGVESAEGYLKELITTYNYKVFESESGIFYKME